MTDHDSSPETQPFVPVPPEPEPVGAEAPQAPPVQATGVRPGTTRLGGASRWVNVALALAIAIAIGGIGFAAGRLTAPVSAAGGGNGRTFTNGQFPTGGQLPGGSVQGGPGDGGGFRGIFGGGGASIQGTVESISGDTLTLKLASGQTIQISLSGTTAYHSEAAASSSDVKTGGTVIVRLDVNRGGQGSGTATLSATDVTVVP